MNTDLGALQCNQDTMPSVDVPDSTIWDFVEYLFANHTPAVYRHDEDHYSICFPDLSLEQVRRLLADWPQFRDVNHGP